MMGNSRNRLADIAMRSPNLDGFLAHGGKLLVAHGAADPVFSVKDTIAWWDEVKGRYGGRADDVVRLFVVPGMAHCGGGPTTDQFDMLAALIDWVEHGKAPQKGGGHRWCPIPLAGPHSATLCLAWLSIL
jgi:feruloyl esterase